MHSNKYPSVSQVINCSTEAKIMSPVGKTQMLQSPAYERSDASQQSQYVFPYHYIPSLDNGHFSQHLYWSWGLHYLAAMQLVLDILAEEPFDTLIDVGCGDGRLLREVNRHFTGKRLLGVDYSSRAINLARAMNPHLDFECIDICADKLQQPAFDVVTLLEVLEHIPVDFVDDFVRAFADFQKSGGRLILTVPHKNKTLPTKHCQHFDSATLQKLLQPTYEIERIIFIDKTTRLFGRILHLLLANRFFILSNRCLLDLLYRIYRSRFFSCAELQCNGICLVARKK